VKLRYRQPDQDCRVSNGRNGMLEVQFDVPQADVTPGQFAVFYEDDRCLGGAVIDRAIPTREALRRTG